MELQVKMQEMARRTYLEDAGNKQDIKSICYVFSGYNQRNKVCFEYLECKLQ